ncbi:19740_t:CDS:2 [Funneliformis geosporum]|uniref:19740_t:CDS:1 n=1 Tax=Funneliformis geosporum TaxID=1117311 RepID=A0A9W4WNE5_9GLOM|nr:19740_t:CDS:2 [Funneliformis geosporum]
MAFEFFPRLSQNFSQLLEDADDYNILIKVGENPNTKEFHAHSNILRSRSPYFKKALSQDLVTKNKMIEFTIPNISSTVFEMILRFMYSGILDLSKQVGSDILDLLVASEELLMEELATFVQKSLIENNAKWLRQNLVKALHAVFQLESCKQIQDYCLNFICNDPIPFLNSIDFPTLEKNILLELIKREDLLIDEIELWNFLIKWGIAQTSELRGKNISNLGNWNKKDFIALKNTLNQFITHIRFYDISSKDFHSKIWPFKKVLPKALFKEIFSFHMLNTEPNQTKSVPRYKKISVDSMIINSKHAAILTNWIQRKDPDAIIPIDSKYYFNLIYRGSRDGFDINTIRSKCNGRGPCILIIKTKENGTIIGGYNPLVFIIFILVILVVLIIVIYGGDSYCDNCGRPYKNYGYGEPQTYSYSYYWAVTTESFIFSLGNGNDLKNLTISRVVNGNNAIYEANYQNMALNFGNSDLVINNDSGTCNQDQYESKILDINSFTIEEMEIFVL